MWVSAFALAVSGSGSGGSVRKQRWRQHEAAGTAVAVPALGGGDVAGGLTAGRPWAAMRTLITLIISQGKI